MEEVFKKIFDVSKLDDNALGQIEWVLNSPAYMHTFRPFLERARASAIKILLDRTVERKERFSDEALAERANAIEELMVFFDRIIKETQSERVFRALNEDPRTDDYDRDRMSGAVKPPNATTNPPEYDPAEDF